MLRQAIGAALALTLAAFCCTGQARPEPPLFEIIHFWHAPSEQHAFNVITDEFRRRHSVKWVERSLSSSDAVRERALQRIIQGYPPDAVQWHPSSEVWNLYDMGVTHSLTALAEKLNLKEKLPGIVLDTVVADGEYVALPTNIHGENLVWYSVPVYNELGLSYPDTWERLLEQALTFKKAGVPAVAMGAEDWEKRVFFLTILGSLNIRTYTALLSEGDPSLLDRPEVLRSYEIMAALRDASRVDRPPSGWAEAAARVAAGRAGIQFMGDWVKRELDSQGYVLNTHYVCRPPPGDNPTFMAVVDGFIFPVTDRQNESLYEKFAEVALDPAIQLEFALKKGALPVLKDISDERFDECAQIGLEALRAQSGVMPSPAMFTSRNFGVVIQSVAAELWNTGMSPRQALDMLREELELSRELDLGR